MQSNKNKTQKDFFLAGKNVSWITAMFSIVATETSVLTFISVPGIAYRGENRRFCSNN
jgi:Na+/proline symporter